MSLHFIERKIIVVGSASVRGRFHEAFAASVFSQLITCSVSSFTFFIEFNLEFSESNLKSRAKSSAMINRKEHTQ